MTGQPPRPWQLSQTEAREACRALKGMPLREEVYALDGSEARPGRTGDRAQLHHRTAAARDQRRSDGPQNYHAVLLTHVPREHHRALRARAVSGGGGEVRADPRITHDVVLAIDEYGNPLRSASAGYGRRYPDQGLPRKTRRTQAGCG